MAGRGAEENAEDEGGTEGAEDSEGCLCDVRGEAMAVEWSRICR